MSDAYVDQIRKYGYAVVADILPPPTVESLIAAVKQIPQQAAVRRRSGTYGIRHLLETCPAVRSLAASPEIRQLVTPVLSDECFAVRAIFFDKVPDANWHLGWHQDSVIAVKEKRETRGFCAWSEKAGVWQVRPPASVLSGMLAIRVHLDDCRLENGPLRVLPGSHAWGWLDDEIDSWKAETPEVVCTVPAGGVVAMRPLLLHASAAADSPQHRRVIHIEFASSDLPGDLEWNTRVY